MKISQNSVAFSEYMNFKSKIAFDSALFSINIRFPKKKENHINDKSKGKNNFRPEDRFHCTVVILVCGTAILLVGVGTTMPPYLRSGTYITAFTTEQRPRAPLVA